MIGPVSEPNPPAGDEPGVRDGLPASTAEHRAAAELAFRAGTEITGIAEQTHRVFADRSFGLLGRLGRPVKLVHDTISSVAYGSVKAGFSAGSVLAGAGVEAGALVSGRSPAIPSDTAAGSMLIAAALGWSGDRLHREQNPLVRPMALRHQGREVEVSTEGLAQAYGSDATRIVVFLHGLMETEHLFWLGTGPANEDGVRKPNIGERAHEELGITPVYVRYNSGRHVSENGRELAQLLESLVEQWPGQLDEISIFGHSMGGLIARSANHHAQGEGLGYVNHLRAVICSGSPHHGSPLEMFANWGEAALNFLPESGAFGGLVASRSSGIKDMRYGNVVDEDWRDHDPAELWADHRVEIPIPDSIPHYFISASLTADPQAPVSRVIGDSLVVLRSAWAEGLHESGERYAVGRSINIGRTTHFHLTSHPAVIGAVLDWLRPAELPARVPG